MSMYITPGNEPVKAKMVPVEDLSLMKDLKDLEDKQREESGDPYYDLKKAAGLVYVGKGDEGEPQWMGTNEEWYQFMRLERIESDRQNAIGSPEVGDLKEYAGSISHEEVEKQGGIAQNDYSLI